jgi:hypothetical protein
MMRDLKLDSSFGIMASISQANGQRIRSMGLEFGNPPMEMCIWDNG